MPASAAPETAVRSIRPAQCSSAMPFLPLPNFDVQWKVHEAYHKHPYIQKEMAKWNAIYYTSNLLPQYEFIGRGKPPKTLADWKGMRVRAIGGIGDAMRNLGGEINLIDRPGGGSVAILVHPLVKKVRPVTTSPFTQTPFPT